MSLPPIHRNLLHFLINPKFQLKMLSYFFILFLISTLSLYSATFILFWKLKEKALNVGIPSGHLFFQFLENQKHDFDLLFLGLAVLNLLLLMVVGFMISHRIAGPIIKFKNYLLAWSETSDDFKLRSNDFFQDLETAAQEIKQKLK
jgi:hypothetical protein